MALRDDKSVSRGRSVAAIRGEVPGYRLAWRAKRLFDIAAATTGLILFSPLLLITSTAIRLDSCGPILIRESLFGYKNRPIQVFKFRTAIACSENDQTGRRLTRVGRVLSRTGIDELPRLFNVLRGEMSIVGPDPRPHPKASLNRAKPGITDWAQIVGFATRERRINADLH
jgi:lipopolysaccharide/colanic/teichoic acid biosynthesis glycosyltransferase